MSDTFTQRSKRCLVHLGIIQMVFQKVAHVSVVLRTSVDYLQSIHPVVPPMHVCARNRDGRPLTLAYVHSRGLVFWLLFSKVFQGVLGYHEGFESLFKKNFKNSLTINHNNQSIQLKIIKGTKITLYISSLQEIYVIT